MWGLYPLPQDPRPSPPAFILPLRGESLKPGHNYGSSWATRKEESQPRETSHKRQCGCPRATGREKEGKSGHFDYCYHIMFFQKVHFGEKEEVETPGYREFSMSSHSFWLTQLPELTKQHRYQTAQTAQVPDSTNPGPPTGPRAHSPLHRAPAAQPWATGFSSLCL